MEKRVQHFSIRNVYILFLAIILIAVTHYIKHIKEGVHPAKLHVKQLDDDFMTTRILLREY